MEHLSMLYVQRKGGPRIGKKQLMDAKKGWNDIVCYKKVSLDLEVECLQHMKYTNWNKRKHNPWR